MAKIPRFSIWIIGFLLFLAIGRDVLVNDRPLWCKVDGYTCYPAFRAMVSGNQVAYGIPAIDSLENDNLWWQLYPDRAVFAPVAYNPAHRNTQRLRPGQLEPGRPARFRHWMGTDGHGSDVLAGAIWGTRTALLIGLWTTLVVLFLGGILGAIAGFFGNTGLSTSRGRLILILLGLFAAFFWGFMARSYALNHQPGWWVWVESWGLFLAILTGSYVLGGWLGRVPFFNKKIVIPADMLIMRVAEVFDAMPKLILLITIAAMLPERNLYIIMAVIGILAWPESARFVRSELLRVRSLDYIEAARFLDFSEWRILFKHALPNAIRPVLLAVSLASATAILLEASLSFLNISTGDASLVTWGKMLQNAREHLEDWWTFLPPGLLIAMFVAALYEAAREH